jgi:hypothetical protein
MYVPSTTYSDANYWDKKDIEALSYDEEMSIDGHMPFGVSSYPKEKQILTFWQQYQWIIIALAIIVILVIAAVVISRRKK